MPETVPKSPAPFLFHKVFMVMSEQNRTALKKIISSMLIKDYPDIYDINVTSSCFYGNCYYNVYLLIDYDDMLKLDGDVVRDKVKQLGKYVLTGQDKIQTVSFASKN
jgi:hypothetical protein